MVDEMFDFLSVLFALECGDVSTVSFFLMIPESILGLRIFLTYKKNI